MNRIDEIVVFHALGEEHIKSIAKISSTCSEPAGKLDYALDVSEAALTEIAKVGFDPSAARACSSARSSPRSKSAREVDPRGPLRPEGHDRSGPPRRKMVFETKKTVRAAAWISTNRASIR